ncbi:hypothetical protein [Micromonospora sp. NPDC048843]|uniref:hypothetical protein n=1 Tax=Micromonospora sp. NPDC048843 TaxID=3155389 RepID=UPI0033DAF137
MRDRSIAFQPRAGIVEGVFTVERDCRIVSEDHSAHTVAMTASHAGVAFSGAATQPAPP